LYRIRPLLGLKKLVRDDFHTIKRLHVRFCVFVFLVVVSPYAVDGTGAVAHADSMAGAGAVCGPSLWTTCHCATCKELLIKWSIQVGNSPYLANSFVIAGADPGMAWMDASLVERSSCDRSR
jgi:hypothetical protein